MNFPDCLSGASEISDTRGSVDPKHCESSASAYCYETQFPDALDWHVTPHVGHDSMSLCTTECNAILLYAHQKSHAWHGNVFVISRLVHIQASTSLRQGRQLLGIMRQQCFSQDCLVLVVNDVHLAAMRMNILVQQMQARNN